MPTKKKTMSKSARARNVQKKLIAARDAIAAYVDAEIALWQDPPNPAMAHSAMARVFLYAQVDALKKLDQWVVGELAIANLGGKRK